MHHAGNSLADHTGRHRACPTIKPRVNILLKANDHLRYTPQVSKSTTPHRLQHVDMVAINPLTGRGSATPKSIPMWCSNAEPGLYETAFGVVLLVSSTFQPPDSGWRRLWPLVERNPEFGPTCTLARPS